MNSAWSDPAFADIARLVARRTGLVFAPNRCQALEQAVQHVMQSNRLHDLRDFERKLESGALSWDALYSRMTVGETYFFREPEHFEFLRTQVLPGLAELRGRKYRPRVWSAGCASGEEAYSLAIALAESHVLDGAFVLGTDLSGAALARARAGRYKKWSLRGVPSWLVDKYFRWADSEAVLAPEIRAGVLFQELNLAGIGYPSPASSTFAMDLILCRNVLIYLNAETIAAVAHRLFACLAPGGFLLTGPSDPLLSGAGFEIESTPVGMAYRRPITGLPLTLSSARAPVVGLSPVRASQPSPGVRTALPTQRDLRALVAGAVAEGDDQALRALSIAHPDEAWISAAALRALGRSAPVAVVEAECRAALLCHPLCAELHYLHALTLLELRQRSTAAEALRRAVYLDGALAIAHFTLGATLAGLHDAPGAERAYRNAERCARSGPATEPLRCAPEITAQGLAVAAARELELLQSRSGTR